MSPRERESVRTCLGCRRQRPRSQLIRIARGPDASVCFDLEGRLPGRGAWVCPGTACVDRLSAGALGHVLRGPVLLPSPARRRQALAGALERRVANLLSMARRLRGATFGPAGVRAMLAADRARLLLTTAGQPADTAASWARRAGEVPVRTLPDAAALGALFGTGELEVAAITAAGLAGALLPAIDRWQTFVDDSCDNQDSGTHRRARVAPGDAAAGGG